MNKEIKEILDYLKNDDYSPVFADEGYDDTPYKLFEECEIKVLLDYITNLQQEIKSLKGNCRVLGEKNNNQKKELNYLNQENKNLKLQLKGTTHCYDETELKAFKKKINNIIEYCRTTQMTFEEFIELERIANK